MGNLNAVFNKNSFALITETSKAIEYENRNSKEIVYLLHTVGISIVLNPNNVKKYHNS